jgi:hypothetical protein
MPTWNDLPLLASSDAEVAADDTGVVCCVSAAGDTGFGEQ